MNMQEQWIKRQNSLLNEMFLGVFTSISFNNNNKGDILSRGLGTLKHSLKTLNCIAMLDSLMSNQVLSFSRCIQDFLRMILYVLSGQASNYLQLNRVQLGLTHF